MCTLSPSFLTGISVADNWMSDMEADAGPVVAQFRCNAMQSSTGTMPRRQGHCPWQAYQIQHSQELMLSRALKLTLWVEICVAGIRPVLHLRASCAPISCTGSPINRSRAASLVLVNGMNSCCLVEDGNCDWLRHLRVLRIQYLADDAKQTWILECSRSMTCASLIENVGGHKSSYSYCHALQVVPCNTDVTM